MRGFVTVFGMLMVLAPGMFTLRIYRALTQGYMGNAEVISVVYNATENLTHYLDDHRTHRSPRDPPFWRFRVVPQAGLEL